MINQCDPGLGEGILSFVRRARRNAIDVRHFAELHSLMRGDRSPAPLNPHSQARRISVEAYLCCWKALQTTHPHRSTHIDSPSVNDSTIIHCP